MNLTKRILESIDEKELHPGKKLVPKAKPSGLWVDEFGPEYDVPEEILNHPRLEDMSWHNDTSPSFGRYDDGHEIYVRLWVEHPDPDKREYGGGRFIVAATVHGEPDPEGLWGGEDSYETDDVNEAIKMWEEAESIYLGAVG